MDTEYEVKCEHLVITIRTNVCVYMMDTGYFIHIEVDETGEVETSIVSISIMSLSLLDLFTTSS